MSTEDVNFVRIQRILKNNRNIRIITKSKIKLKISMETGNVQDVI